MSEYINKNDTKKQKLMENFNQLKYNLIIDGFNENEVTISVKKANIYAFLTAGPIALICFIIYIHKWNSIYFEFTTTTLILYFLGIVFFTVIHELLHGFTWSLFCKNTFKSVSFGMMWDSFTPYCHCKEPLDFKAYITGGLMPLFILGILIFIISFFTGNSLVLIWSLINILCSGGDTTICLSLFKYKDALFIDHPTECGFVAFTK